MSSITLQSQLFAYFKLPQLYTALVACLKAGNSSVFDYRDHILLERTYNWILFTSCSNFFTWTVHTVAGRPDAQGNCPPWSTIATVYLSPVTLHGAQISGKLFRPHLRRTANETATCLLNAFVESFRAGNETVIVKLPIHFDPAHSPASILSYDTPQIMVADRDKSFWAKYIYENVVWQNLAQEVTSFFHNGGWESLRPFQWSQTLQRDQFQDGARVDVISSRENTRWKMYMNETEQLAKVRIFARLYQGGGAITPKVLCKALLESLEQQRSVRLQGHTIRPEQSRWFGLRPKKSKYQHQEVHIVRPGGERVAHEFGPKLPYYDDRFQLCRPERR